jgi:hypothetical protein
MACYAEAMSLLEERGARNGLLNHVIERRKSRITHSEERGYIHIMYPPSGMGVSVAVSGTIVT